MTDVRLRLRLPTLSLDESIVSVPQEPLSPDSGFSSDESTSPSPVLRVKSERLRSALRRLPTGCRKKVRFGEAVVVQLEPYREGYHYQAPSFSPRLKKVALALPNFTFRSESEYFQRARDGGICVSAIRHCGMSMLVQLAVHNRAFDKNVFIRWSADKWQYKQDQMAVYSHRATDDIDIFTASLPLKNGDAELCCCYLVDGREHWDSNDGLNYLISLKN